MDEQDRVAAFVAEHGLETDLAYRVLDLESEVGEVAKEVATSTDYGSDPDAAAIASDELGDALFALLALAETADVDAGDALAESLAKYERRLDASADAGSGR
ncbi:nucleotide pyrophosphohydrolase [Halorubrum sp. Ib24]|uniref:MazG nucleotide pyrophosphohydrolase domain-containing protein n=1 Tax=unclassified Halorubrum TaxID=2642239 RepID=UPI000B994303|nr:MULTISPECIES: MazG-like family protein [unclassified Halorubrum]OYR40903.1 nucleotide pyrophosphohydrolase [Halorubrum sp. Hd13]OYR41107.1 nucleotide pyrophosphohydrolase [Halorubrum sp. Ib24]OYR44287.1 nucleotide pyrophosphohydrolase [Halorubrum sp. Eb13]OYR49477.1 nucleotide pyrophosphohydrolase [Halorubrum sp. Ea8]OYR54974.1 nucleotide pyrophosphohydrolase [Halorubrum sp. Ea1]